jgi:hypothetical protein
MILQEEAATIFAMAGLIGGQGPVDPAGGGARDPMMELLAARSEVLG